MEWPWMFKVAGWFPWISSLSCVPRVWRIKSSTRKETLPGWRRVQQSKYFDVPCTSYWGWNFFTILAVFIAILSCPTCWLVNALAVIYLPSRPWKSCRCFTLLKMIILFIWGDWNHNSTCIRPRWRFSSLLDSMHVTFSLGFHVLCGTSGIFWVFFGALFLIQSSFNINDELINKWIKHLYTT